MGLRDDLLATSAAVKIVPVADCGVPGIHVRTPSAADWAWHTFETFAREDRGDNGERLMHARLICITACDAEGNLLFARSEVEAVGKIPATVTTKICNAATELLPKVAEANERAKNS